MSKTRHHGALLRSFALDYHSPQTLTYPTPGWDCIVHASQGVLSVAIPHLPGQQHTWVVPSHQALWVPDGQQPSISFLAPARLRSLFLRRGAARRLPRYCSVLSLPPFLSALMEHFTQIGVLFARLPAHRRLASVLYDQLAPAPGQPLAIPQPKHPEAQRFADLLRQAPPATPLRELARQFGSSLRTLERLFAADLGLSLAAWRRRLRLQRALELLALQKNVAETAYLCGYSSVSAFVSLFRREFGTTPARYFAAWPAP